MFRAGTLETDAPDIARLASSQLFEPRLTPQGAAELLCELGWQLYKTTFDNLDVPTANGSRRSSEEPDEAAKAMRQVIRTIVSDEDGWRAQVVANQLRNRHAHPKDPAREKDFGRLRKRLYEWLGRAEQERPLTSLSLEPVEGREAAVILMSRFNHLLRLIEERLPEIEQALAK